MGEEDRNPEIIRRLNQRLSYDRKEQQIRRFRRSPLTVAYLLLLGGFLWLSCHRTKQSVPEEIAFQFPIPAPPAEEDNSVEIEDNDVSDDTSNTDDETDNMDNVNADTTDDNIGGMEEAPSTTEPVVAKNVKTPAQPRPKKTVATIPAYIITREGMTLRSLARLYYGSEVFWVYIYDLNMRVLSSLDTLPSGIRLELPRPADYGINATEPLSLQRACKMAKSLAIHEKKQQSIK